MSLIRSRVFIPVGLAPGVAIVPAGKRWLVKYACINNNTGSPQSWSVQVQPSGGTNRNIFNGTVATGAQAVLPQPFTLSQGDTLTVSGASAALVVSASGIEFTP
jgi:hypothetical protein